MFGFFNSVFMFLDMGKFRLSFFGGMGWVNYFVYIVVIVLFFINFVIMLFVSFLNCGLF